MFDAETTKNILIALGTLIVAAIGIAPLYLKAIAKRAEANATRTQADAEKEVVESGSLRFVLEVAQTSLENTRRISDLERRLHEYQVREIEYKANVSQLTQDLEDAKNDIIRLRARVVELETELQKKESGNVSEPQS